MSRRHGERVLSEWQSLLDILKKKQQIELQGDALDTSRLVAVARFGPLNKHTVFVFD
jgi:hypothetical protein